MRLLFIDGDNSLEDALHEVSDTYVVDRACSGDEGLYMYHVNDYDAVVIDYCLEDIPCIDTCKTVREVNETVPVLVLTAENNPAENVRVIDAGADSYITKPVNIAELEANIRALTRRNLLNSSKDRHFVGDLCLDFRSKEVYYKDIPVLLRRKEYAVLEYLILNKGRVISKEELLEHVWDGGMSTFSNTAEVHIKHLRDKIERTFDIVLIHTIRGFGYKINK
jgi:two-component system, OmpR family, response regulator